MRAATSSFRFQLKAGQLPLNRLTAKTYSDGTPTVILYYDLNNPFGIPVSNPIGRLVAVWTGTNPQWAVWTTFSHDPVGRVATQTDCLYSPAASCQNIVTTTLHHDLAGISTI